MRRWRCRLVELQVTGSTTLKIGLGLGQWGVAAAVNLVTRASTSTSSLYVLRDDSPLAMLLGWTPPIRAWSRFQPSLWTWAGRDQPNILSLDLNFYFNL